MNLETHLARGALGGRMLSHLTSFNLERYAQVVKENKIYFSRPAEFNDPFEVSPFVDLDTLDDDDVRARWLDSYVNSIRTWHGDAAISRVQGQIEAARRDPQAAKEFLAGIPQSLIDTLQRKYRVYCLSTQLGSVQMWSHYGAKHRGVAFEFDSLGEFFGKAYRVNYVREATPIDSEATDGADLFVHGLITKAAAWQTEEEYRLVATDEGEEGFIHSEAGIVTSPPHELRAIYVGCNMPDACIRAVVNEAASRPDPLPVRQMVKVPHRLALSAKQLFPPT